jgi:Fic family protein
MSNLVKYINDDSHSEVDPLVKMAVIHFQFESIQPFFDGNGRTGRIINILYLIQKSLLHLPILYLSRFIIDHKGEYYQHLQNVREKGEWEPWILFMLEGIEKTSIETIALILEIKKLMMDYKHRIRAGYKFYSQELINNLFRHPYTKIEFIQNDLEVSRVMMVSLPKRDWGLETIISIHRLWPCSPDENLYIDFLKYLYNTHITPNQF